MDRFHDTDEVVGLMMEDVIPLISEFLEMGRYVSFFPKGRSMLPMLREGIDSVVLSPPAGKLNKYDIPLYQRTDGKYVLHRIVKVRESYTCMGDNQFRPETGISHDQVIAYVSSFRRGDKAYRVDDTRYLLYCRFWHYTRPFRRLYRKFIAFIRNFFK